MSEPLHVEPSASGAYRIVVDERADPVREAHPRAPETSSRTTQASPRADARPSSERMLVTVLSGVAGYIDAVGFVTLLGLFPAHVTGELVSLTAALSTGYLVNHAGRLAVIPLFVAAVFMAAVVSRWLERARKSPSLALLAMMTLALGVFSVIGLFLPRKPATASWLLVMAEGSVVVAMGFQNAFMRQVLRGSCATTVMTGNLTHVTFELADACLERLGLTPHARARSVEATARMKLVSGALASFVGGALAGGYLTSRVGPISVVLPTIATALAAAHTRAQTDGSGAPR